jgi:ribosomal protein L24E
MQSAFLSKRDPGQINWAVLYTRKHKKGQSEKIQRNPMCSQIAEGHHGASPDHVSAKRNQKPELERLNENKLFGLPTKQKRVSKHLRISDGFVGRNPTKVEWGKHYFDRSLIRFLNKDLFMTFKKKVYLGVVIILNFIKPKPKLLKFLSGQIFVVLACLFVWWYWVFFN